MLHLLHNIILLRWQKDPSTLKWTTLEKSFVVLFFLLGVNFFSFSLISSYQFDDVWKSCLNEKFHQTVIQRFPIFCRVSKWLLITDQSWVTFVGFVWMKEEISKTKGDFWWKIPQKNHGKLFLEDLLPIFLFGFIGPWMRLNSSKNNGQRKRLWLEMGSLI